MPVILRFLHGWAFDASFWNEVRGKLPQWPAESDDRGYFGNPRTVTATGPSIVVAHSFGTLRALRNLPAGCRGLIAINGFDRFCAGQGVPGVAPRIVDAMIAKLDRSAEAVVADFRRRCGSPASPGHIAPEPLREDLLALRDLNCSRAELDVPILALHGGSDPILSPSMRAAIFRSAPRVERLDHPNGGHVLPLTDPAYCAAAIHAFAERAG